MDPTSLPTDSLYKFWALGSMLALGSVLYFARRRSRELHAQKDALELEIKKHNRRIAHVNTDVDAGAAGALERQRQAELAAAEAEHRMVTLNKLLTAGNTSANWSLLGIGLSFISLLLGFYSWYQKAQRYQDEATIYALREQKAKTELVELELNERRQASKIAVRTPSGAVPPAP